MKNKKKNEEELYFELLEEILSEEDEVVPDEESAMTEEEVKTLAKAHVYDELDTTEKKQLLSSLLGYSTGKAHSKKFSEKVTTSNAVQKAYQHLLEKLQDDNSISCPICHQLWEKILPQEAENLGQNEELQVGIPVMRLIHVKTKHIAVWNLIKGLFGKDASEIPDYRPSTTPNPESCSEDPEDLSNEELAEKIGSSEELRKEFFREWLRRLKSQ